MSEEETWGPWIEHDGGHGPWVDGRRTIQMMFQVGGVTPGGASTTQLWPGFFWRWKTVRKGWFGRQRIRVCDDPAYAPIIRYRFREPRAMRDLREIVANPAPLPEGVDA